MKESFRAARWPLIIAAALTGLLAGNLIGPATATHQPADKVAVSGSGVETLKVALTEGNDSEEISLLSATLRTSTPTDLLFAVTAECALFTDTIIRTPPEAGASDQSEAIAAVKIWVTIDGAPVKVASDDAEGDEGKVVFCNRAQFNKVTIGPEDDDEDDHTFEQYLRTRTANAFNWLALNVGSGAAEALVGKRTLFVHPEKLANDATI